MAISETLNADSIFSWNNTKPYVEKQTVVEGHCDGTRESRFFAVTWSDTFLKFTHFASEKGGN